MKKKFYVLSSILLLSLATPAYAESTSGSSVSANSATSAQSSQATGNSSSTAASSNTSSSTNTNNSQNTGTNAAENQTQNSTTTVAENQSTPQNSVEQVPKGQDSAPATNSTQSSSSDKETKSSTTIINETVNNTGKGTNILLVVLSSLSATVTIIGGVTALIRHFRKKSKKGTKETVRKPSRSSENQQKPKNSQTYSQIDSHSQTSERPPLFEEPLEKSASTSSRELGQTQQLNKEADELLKQHKKQTNFRRRRR